MYTYVILMLFMFGIVKSSQFICPDQKPIENFDFDFYTSHYWYQIERYDNGWEEDQDCLAIYFDTAPDVRIFNIIGIKGHEIIYTTGHIELGGKKNIGTVNFDSEQILASIGTNFIQVNITFMSSRAAVAYHCTATENGLQEFAWVLILQSTLTYETEKELDEYFKTVDTFNRSKFKPVNHSNCYKYS